MSIEDQFDREKQGAGARAFDSLLPDEREAVTKAFQLLIDHSGSGHASAMRVVMGFLHGTYKAELMESKLGLDPVQSHVIDETWRARCGAVIEVMDLTTEPDSMLAVFENLTQE